jgi:hypothetical protein
MDEPLPGHKVEKRKKRRWDRKPEVTNWFSTWMGECSFSVVWTVPHITLRETQKSNSCLRRPTRRNDRDKRSTCRRSARV